MAKTNFEDSLNRLVKALGEEIKRLQNELNSKVDLYNTLTGVPIDSLILPSKKGRSGRKGKRKMSAAGRARIAAAARARWKKAKAEGKTHL